MTLIDISIDCAKNSQLLISLRIIPQDAPAPNAASGASGLVLNYCNEVLIVCNSTRWEWTRI